MQPDGAAFEMRETAARIASFGRCVAVWFVIVLPVSPSIWALCARCWVCFSPAWTSVGEEPAACLLSFAFFAPFAVIFGPLAGSEEEESPSIWPEILLTAILLALLITTLSFVLRGRRAAPPN
jgi:hypothetical protein